LSTAAVGQFDVDSAAMIAHKQVRLIERIEP
jgi:hypothetical protein